MKTFRILALLSLVFAVAIPLQSAIFVKIPSIPGESKDKEHKGWIDVLSVSGLMESSGGRDAATGLATGKRRHAPIKITKRIDKASPMLARSSNNSSFPSQITISKNGMQYELTGVVVTSVRKLGKNEELTLTFKAMKVTSNVGRAAATDYNSSRSNNSSRAATAPANHNTTRSNR